MAPPHVRTLHGSDGVLLTGATGFVGMELLARYLENTDRPIYTLVRAEDQAAATERIEQKLFELFGDEASFPEDRIVAVPGDVEAPGLGLFADDRALLAEHVSEVVHAAASVSFELPLEDSRRINVEGTREVLDFAQLCQPRGGLRGFTYISTAYVAGTHAGEFGEEQLEVGQEFRNPYERSKFEAERLVRDHEGRLPIRIFRPSIVVGEAASGWTTSFNVLYAPLKAFVRGVLPVLPARRRTPVDVVPVDYLPAAVLAIPRRPAEGLQTYHLVAGEQATTVGELVDLTAKELGRRKPLIVPLALYRRVLH